MSKFKLTLELKQHTPIIHFQHEQHGATLRATELKPKLDKFLIDKLGGGDSLREQHRDWFISEQHPALDYKVRIEAKIPDYTGEVEIMPSSNEKWILHKTIRLDVFSFNSDLLKEINQHIELFFILHNFGKRQSKGFGCFYPSVLEEENFLQKARQSGRAIYKYNGILHNEIQNNTYFYDRIISPNWHRLKSGKNYNGYEKSRVFDFLCDNDLRWDKRWIKRKLKKFIENGQLPEKLQTRGNPPEDCDGATWEEIGDNEYRFGRAMLGLAEHFEYRAYRGYVYQVKVDNDEIERFKSPVTFKVFKKNIYAIAEGIEQDIFDSPFSFEVQKKNNGDSEGRTIPISGILKTPKQTEFSLIDFLDDYFSEVGFNRI